MDKLRVFRLTAYKSDAVDYCMGNVVERFNAISVKEVFDTADQLLDHMVELYLHNLRHVDGDAEYEEIEVLCTDDYHAAPLTWTNVTEDFVAIAQAKAHASLEQFDREVAQRKAEEKQRQIEAAERAERNVYERLKKKFDR